MKIDKIKSGLDLMIKNPKCELIYHKDYELVIAVMLSAQCTDKRVNIVTKNLFEKYSLDDLANLSQNDIEDNIRSLGSYTKKAYYLKEIATHLLNDYNGKVPCDRNYLESLPGIGRKSASVILSELFNVPTIAVDTHVKRVANRLGISKSNDIRKIEKDIQRVLDKDEYNKVNHELLLFGRYICKSISPDCSNCVFNCKYKKTKK